MTQQEFDISFQEITKEMVEIAFEWVDFNKTEIDCVYVFGSIEEGTLLYKKFYKVNGQVVQAHKVNTVSGISFNLDGERESALLRLGTAALRKLHNLFIAMNKDIPTLVKMKYQPKTGNFECKLSYELQYSYSDDRSYVDVYDEWFAEEKNVK